MSEKSKEIKPRNRLKPSNRLNMGAQSKTASKYQNELIKKRKNDISKDIKYIEGQISELDSSKYNTIVKKSNDFINKIKNNINNNSLKQRNDYINLRMKKNLEKIHIQIDGAVNHMKNEIDKARKFAKLAPKDFENDEDDGEKTIKSKKKKIIKSDMNFIVALYNGKEDLSINEVENLTEKLIKFDGKIQCFFNSLDSASTISNIESALDNLYKIFKDFKSELESGDLLKKIEEIIESYDENQESISNLNSKIENREKKQNRLENRERHILKTWESYKKIVDEGKTLKAQKNNVEHGFRVISFGFFSALKQFHGVIQRIKNVSSSFDDDLATVNKIKDL